MSYDIDAVERDAEHTVTLVLTIKGYGKRERLKNEFVLRIHRALNHVFGADKITLTDPDTNKGYAFDPFADDGHHPGHELVLKEIDGT